MVAMYLNSLRELLPLRLQGGALSNIFVQIDLSLKHTPSRKS